MKRLIFLISFLCFNLFFSQKQFKYKDTHFPIKYILKNSTDTIRTRVQNMGLYTNKKFSSATYINNMYVIDSLGNKTKVPEQDIAYMEITDLQNVKRKIISSSTVFSKDFGLLETIYEGNKTAYYRSANYSVSIYSPMIIYSDYLIFKTDKSIVELGSAGRFKIKMKQKFSAYPDILLLIDSWKYDNDLIKILDRYERK
ncbi:hypothetical protein [Chryseobacterium limigenitum]|uniref:Uncharacterized protein n=1 Tax=Chryseobacterium limigenitum TaxID=1612149 RepID=A0A1K2ISL4_9FLAO|nr:hypothetical protein [Chryseobacterium limigenitum]SFZ94707.1 hypothetical protein SAMN05216324_107177 [Chryseobacterium limigenitum]